MPEITPAIIAKNFKELSQKIKFVEPYVDWVQLDVMDGKFVPEKTWPYSAEATKGKYKPEDLKKIKTNLNLEVHLMVLEPEKEIEKWIISGVKRILVHFEATKYLEEIIKKVKKAGLEIGIVLNLETPIEVLDELDELLVRPFDSSSRSRAAGLAQGVNNLLPEQANEVSASKANIDVIQLMAIKEIGYYGHNFDDRVIPRIKSLRQKYQNVKIAIDGGINDNTAKKVAQVGANILAVGSAIFASRDIGRAIKELKSITDNKNYV